MREGTVLEKLLEQISAYELLNNLLPGALLYALLCRHTGHQFKMVTNAYIRRGANVYEARDKVIQHHCGDMPKREGWKSANALEFSEEVEDWND